MTKHKNKSALPEWFSLEKYAMPAPLDAAGWYVQLSIRARCLAYLSQGEDITEILDLIRAAPIVDVTNHSFLSAHYHSGMFYEQPVIEQSLFGVHSLTVYELYLAEINMEKRKRIQAQMFFNAIFCRPAKNSKKSPLIQEPVFLYESVHRVLREPIDNALLGINLLLPDKELVKRFKAYLPVLRKECGAVVFSEKWHQPIFTEWVRLGVLPYLDLLIWEKQHHAKIPYEVLEGALFPTYEASEDRVRKTTAPKAHELISTKSLALLRAQALLEKGQQRTG